MKTSLWLFFGKSATRRGDTPLRGMAGTCNRGGSPVLIDLLRHFSCTPMLKGWLWPCQDLIEDSRNGETSPPPSGGDVHLSDNITTAPPIDLKYQLIWFFRKFPYFDIEIVLNSQKANIFLRSHRCHIVPKFILWYSFLNFQIN